MNTTGDINSLNSSNIYKLVLTAILSSYISSSRLYFSAQRSSYNVVTRQLKKRAT